MGAGWFGRTADRGDVGRLGELRRAAPMLPIQAEQWAFNLLNRAVTTDRVATVITAIAGDRIEVGPLFFGPGGSVSATGVGIIGRVQVSRMPGRRISFQATVPGELTLHLTVGQKTHSYDGSVEVSLQMDVLLAEPVFLVLEVTPVRPTDVAVRLRTSGMAAFVLQKLGDADREIATQVACVVNDKVKLVEDLCRIDVGTLLDQVWDADLLARLTALKQSP